MQLANSYDAIYFRDPFNDATITWNDARATVDAITERFPGSYFIDGIDSYDALLFEDKWRQFKLFKNYMPLTGLINDVAAYDDASQLLKKRISSRAKGIILSKSALPSPMNMADYIVQEKLTILTELRVFMVSGHIVYPIAIKTSKKADTAVKVISTVPTLDKAALLICTDVYKLMPYDFMGIDIARTETGYKLLEVNRSCQFKAFNRMTSQNLAEALLLDCVKKLRPNPPQKLAV